MKEEAETADLVQRKLQLMKMMLKNEKQANDIMKNKIHAMSSEMHMNNQSMLESAKIRNEKEKYVPNRHLQYK